jgi:predicted acylesterase/phospholipase RssA
MAPQTRTATGHSQIGYRIFAALLLLVTCLTPKSEAAIPSSEEDDLEIPKIDLLLSGGGLRASAFSYGVLAGLDEICLNAKDATISQREKDDQGALKDCKQGSPLLDQVNIISAVSGGAITAAYFKTHREEFFEEFPKLLKTSNLQWRLLKAEKSPTLKRTLRSPVFLLTSIWDTISSIIGLPLSLFSLNIELTPVAVMALSDGLLESEQLTTVYKDLFYQNSRLDDLSEKNGFPFGALVSTGSASNASNGPTLLINATDIANGTVFTFDDQTFECLGLRSGSGNIELAQAVAASSSLPGVFSPVRIDNALKDADPLSIPTNCSPILADRSRKPVLVDGGVTDNLGAIGLLRTVMKRKEGSAGNTRPHHVDARKEKHLLLFINAEAQSASKLPGLAGHFDSSYDVLIRSKKDLVRVMASNMLQHFGFSNVELRMSDLVSTQPDLKKVVAPDAQRSSQETSGGANAADLIPRAMDLTEKEQKIERTLDEIGMLPSPQEIDTLIAMGRKIVSQRFEALGKSFTNLRAKEFRDNCAAVANPDKYWCWPDQFRANDLESGGGSAFLRTLDDVTREFRDNAIKSREALFQEILLKSAEIARQELQTFSGDSDKEKNETLLSFLEKQLLPRDPGTRLHEILMDAKIFPGPPPSCSQNLLLLEEALRDAIPNWKQLEFEQTRIRLNNMLNKYSEANCFPEYHVIRVFPEFLSLGSEGELKNRDLIHVVGLLQRGLNEVSPYLNPLFLHHYLGMLLSWYYPSPEQGLKQFKIAADLAQESAKSLRFLLDKPFGGEEGNRSRVLKTIGRLENFRNVQELSWAYVIVASPVPIAGTTSEVSDRDVLAWEQRYLRDHQGNSLLDLVVTEKPDNSLRTELDEQIDSLATIELGSSKLVAYLCKLRAEIAKPGKPLPLRSCVLPDNIHPIASGNGNIGTAGLVYLAREEVRLKLSMRAGMREARKAIQFLYSEYVKHEGEGSANDQPSSSITDLGPDILQVYGLLHLREAMQEVCPARSRTVGSAISMFRQAIKKFEEVYKNDSAAAVIQTTRVYLDFVERLGC